MDTTYNPLQPQRAPTTSIVTTYDGGGGGVIGASLVRTTQAWSSSLALIIGFPLNVLVCHFILWHTPAEMRCYSKILLQTCLVNMIQLILSELVQPMNFVHQQWYVVYAIGWVEHWSLGWRNAFFLAWFIGVLSSYNFCVVQFVYRYITLNLNIKVTRLGYWLIVGLSNIILVIIAIPFELYGFPTSDCLSALADPRISSTLLALSPRETFVFAEAPGLAICVQTTNSALRVINGLYFFVALVNYTIIIVLGTKMWLFVKKNFTGTHAQHSGVNVAVLQHQLSVNLIIQALLPAIDLFAWTFKFILIQINSNVSSMLMLETMSLMSALLYWMFALSPLVTLCTVRAYKQALENAFYRIFSGTRVAPQTGGGRSARPVSSMNIPMQSSSALPFGSSSQRHSPKT